MLRLILALPKELKEIRIITDLLDYTTCQTNLLEEGSNVDP